MVGVVRSMVVEDLVDCMVGAAPTEGLACMVPVVPGTAGRSPLGGAGEGGGHGCPLPSPCALCRVCRHDSSALSGAARPKEKGIRCLPVTDDAGHAVGKVSPHPLGTYWG